MSSEFGEESLPSDFNYLVYLEINPDIDSELDEKNAINHYLTSGKKDGRIYKYLTEGLPEDFDYRIYKELNYDLRCLNEEQAKHHYLKCAKDDCRIYSRGQIDKENSKNLSYGIPPDFNYLIYKEINPDIDSELDEKDAMIHYLTSCKKDNRIYKYLTEGLPEDFDYRIYKELNYDLRCLNEEQAKHHYLKCAKDDGRIYSKTQLNDKQVLKDNKYITYYLPPDFNYQIYLEINPDLPLFNKTEAIDHYLKYGRNECRIYKYMIDGLPSDFDYIAYKELNYHLSGLNERQAINHYLIHGKDKGFLYKIDNSKYNFNDYIEKFIINIINKINNIDRINNGLPPFIDFNNIFNKILEEKYNNPDLINNSIIFDLQDFNNPFSGSNNSLFSLINSIIIAKTLNYDNIYITGYPLDYNSNKIINANYIYNLNFINNEIQKIYPNLKIFFLDKIEIDHERKYNSIFKLINDPNKFSYLFSNIKKDNILYFGCSFSGYYYNNERNLFMKIFNCIKYKEEYYIKNDNLKNYICLHHRSDEDMLNYINDIFKINNLTIDTLNYIYSIIFKLFDLYDLNYYVCCVDTKYNKLYSTNKTEFRDINAIFEYTIASGSSFFIGFEYSTFSMLVFNNNEKFNININDIENSILNYKNNIFLNN